MAADRAAVIFPGQPPDSIEPSGDCLAGPNHMNVASARRSAYSGPGLRCMAGRRLPTDSGVLEPALEPFREPLHGLQLERRARLA